MTAPQIAIAYANGGPAVALWCHVTERCPNGRIMFEAINGAWEGSILNGMVLVDNGRKGTLPGAIVWEGEAPFSGSRYNEAIAWIEEQLK